MADGQKEDHGQDPVGHSDGPGDAEIFAQDEDRTGNRLADDRQDRFIFNFLTQNASCSERGEQNSRNKERRQTHVEKLLVIIVHRVLGDLEVEDKQNSRRHDENHEDGLTNAFEERVSTDCENLLDHIALSDLVRKPVIIAR